MAPNARTHKFLLSEDEMPTTWYNLVADLPVPPPPPLHPATHEPIGPEALEPLLAQHRYVDALARLATLREPVDGFFDGVMVMVEGPAQRNNRLLMLDRLRRLFLRIADVSVLGAK